MRRSVVLLAALCVLMTLVLGACRSSTPEAIAYKSTEPTADGLRQLEGTDRRTVFLRPGVEMKEYSEIIVDPFMVSYTNPRGESEREVRTLDPETEARLSNVLRDEFIRQLRRSRDLELVEEPGPHAVRLQGWLYDVVVEEPPTDDPRNFPLCFAELNVILTVRHSETAHALARVAERVRLSCATERRALFHTASWKDVSDAVKPWAILLRHWLEDLRAMPSAVN
jgi:hypothetical protein